MADATPEIFKTAPREVTGYFETKGEQPSFDWRDIAPREHAYTWTVAKSAGFDILEDIRSEVDRAIRDRIPFEEFKARLTPTLQQKGWWGRRKVIDPETGEEVLAQLGSPRRLRTIYWANTRTAHAAGEWERTQRNKAFLPYLLYTLSQAENRREEHEGWVNTVLPVDHPFWDTHYPPNGWLCQCGVRQISGSEARRRGYDENAQAPVVETRSWHNKRTGETVDVPVGIDPGWQTNPGKTRAENMATFLSGQIEAMPPGRRELAMADIIRSPVLRAMRDGHMPRAWLPVAPVPEPVVKALSARSSVARLSADSLQHILVEHAQRRLDIDDLRAALSIIATGSAHRGRSSSVVFLGTVAGVTWRVAMKLAAGGEEWWITSFHRKSAKARDAVMRRERAKGNVLVE